MSDPNPDPRNDDRLSSGDDAAARAFAEAVPTPTLVCDPETLAIHAANPAAATLLDHDRGTLTLMGLADVGATATTVDGDPVTDAVASVADAAAGPDAAETDAAATFELRTRLGDPELRVEVACHAATIAGDTWLVAGLTDVSDRVAAETASDAERRVRDAVADTVPTALFRCSEAGTLSWWNDRLAADTGYEPAELADTDVASLFDESTRDAVADALRRVYDGDETAACEAQLVTRSGERVPYRLSLGPVTDGDAVVGAVGVGEDLTAASIREERLAVLTRVLRHNFRNDLNVVTGFARRAAAATDDPTVREELGRVVDTAERLLRLGETSRKVERLLSDRPSPRPVELSPAVEDAVESLQPPIRDAADFDVDVPSETTVSAVAALPEAIAELVDNAVRHNGAAHPRVRVSAAELPSESWVELIVADDGPGIPPAERAVLTGAETPLEHASGLGLWYVNWVVTAAGGGLDIAESKTGGTRVEMTLRSADSGAADERLSPSTADSEAADDRSSRSTADR